MHTSPTTYPARLILALAFALMLMICVRLPAAADPRVQSLLAQALAAQGGAALVKMQTYQEVISLQASGPFGMRMMTQQVVASFDRAAGNGRWELQQNGKTQAVYQRTPQGLAFWTPNAGTQPVRASAAAFLPLMKTGILGLLALQSSPDPVTYVERGEIGGRRGPMLVRTQAAPQETVVLQGKGDLARGMWLTSWSYLFATDGTLSAERITQTQPGKTVMVDLTYDRCQVFGGVKVPMEVNVKNNQLPSMVHMRMQVRQVTVNGPLPAATFGMP